MTFSGVSKCLIIQNHFDLFPLMTYKLVYYLVWCQILNIMQNNEHLTLEGLLKIISLKALFKKGLSNLLINAFPNYVKWNMPKYLPNLNLLSFDWLAGFINADGHFSAGLKVVDWSSTGYYCAPEISIAQDNISIIVLDQIISLLNLGKIYKDGLGGTVSIIRITGIKNINSFISLMSTTQLQGSKALDYADFCQIIGIINNKTHNTLNGINEIKTIVNGMNSRRKC
uniref:LAGLIDADG endonuclease family protein n=1 Tax=Pappia fissilis TaxID=1040649 RepID=UPI002A83FDE7|nr:LAGLIDADG endonuclease family protein [Pappia fissilis]WOX61246.1 LAGLIDADG endonuclease family protein [Pappia fissilis]